MTQKPNYHWPQLFYNKKPLEKLINTSEHFIDPLPLPSEIVEYLVIICDQLKMSMGTLQLTLSVASRYLRLKPNDLPLQLVIVTSLLICCKFLQTNPPDISTLHKFSINSFTNRDLYRTQMIVLKEIDFDITAEGIPDKQIELVIRCVKALLREEEDKIFPSIMTDIEQLFWIYLYTGKIKLREKQRKAITAALVHLSFIFLTQYSGKFLQTLWTCELTGAEEKQVTLLADRFLKQIAGEDKSKNYKI